MFHTLIEEKEIQKAFLWLTKFWEKPIHPDYYNARTIDEAVSLLDRYGEEAKIISGGTDVISLMKNRVLSPSVLVNIKPIKKMKNIVVNPSGIAIGALTLINDIERSALIKSKYPILFEAARFIGSPQIRNMATIGGNLCQEVRCWYYRRSPVTGISFNCCRKSKDGICHAINGENQYHAIIGIGECYAVCPSDMATVLLALDAKINTVAPEGSRVISVDEFYTASGNVLDPNEVITAIQVPKVGSRVKQRFLRFRIRKAIDFAIVSVAAVIGLNNNVVGDAKLVLGGVSPKPYRATKAEDILRGERITESVAAKAAKEAVGDARPLSKNGYKVPIIEALVKRALLEKM